MAVRYIDTDRMSGPYPVPIGLCMTKKDWDAEMKRLKINEEWVPDSNHCHTVTNADGARRCIICLPHIYDYYDTLDDQINAIAHEVTHVWRRVREYICEREPGSEQEAYFIGWVSQWVFKELFGEYNKLKVK